MSKFGVGGAHPGGLHLTKKILRHERIAPNSFILDVGCGTGQTAAYLASRYLANVVGMDINPIMVTKAKERMAKQHLPVEIIQGSIENCPFPDQTFDLILSESVLAFVDKPQALKEIYRVLKRGGRFIANELTSNYQLPPANKMEICEFYGLDSVLLEKEWLHLLESAGFKHIHIRKQNPPMLQYNPASDFQQSSFIEPELYPVMNQHFQIMMKYKGTLDYRVFSGSK